METPENATGSTISRPDAGLLAGAEALGAPAAATARPVELAQAALPAAPAAPAGINWKREAREIFECVALLSMRFPSVKPVYDEPTLDRLSDVWAPVLQKHNLDFGKFAIYITAGLATLPVVKATAEAIKVDLVAERAAAEAAAKPPARAVVDPPAVQA